MSEGPNPENLKHVAGMFPSMMKGLKEGSTHGKGRRVSLNTTRATKLCKICSKGFDLASVGPDSPLMPGICERCQTTLDEGYTALISGDMYAFVKLNTDKELAGQIIPISPQNMDKVQREFQANWKTKDDDTPTAT